MKLRWEQALVLGALILAIACLAGLLVIRASGSIAWWRAGDRPHLHLLAHDVTGLRPGTEVKCRGHTLGSIRTIQPVRHGALHRFALEAELDPLAATWHFHDTAQLGQETLIGPFIVKLTEAPSPPDAPPSLAAGSAAAPIALEPEPPLTAALDHIEPLVLSVGDAVRQTSALLEETRRAVAAFNAPWTTNPAPLTAASPDAPTQMDALVAHLGQIVADLGRLTAALQRADAPDPNEPALVADLKTIVAEIRTLAQTLDRSARQLLAEPMPRGPRARPDQDLVTNLKHTAEELRRLAANAADLSDRLGDTFVGRLLIKRHSEPDP